MDLSALCYPPKNWVPETTRTNGDAVSDVVIIGGGMGGLSAWFALLRAGIRNLRILDRAAEDRIALNLSHVCWPLERYRSRLPHCPRATDSSEEVFKTAGE